MTGQVRLEYDLLGEREVPREALWGVHTARALENFPVSGTPISTHPGVHGVLAGGEAAAR
jgi:aspartate ammonia-lyase